MTPMERKRFDSLRRQCIGEQQLADKLYSALVHGGFDNIWWAMQDYASARGRKKFVAPTKKKAARKRTENEQKMQTWRLLNCEPFYPTIEPDKNHPSHGNQEEDDSQ